MAELLGATLTLTSTPGQGAAFTLRFPATELSVKSEELGVEEEQEPEGQREELSVERRETSLEQDAVPASRLPLPCQR